MQLTVERHDRPDGPVLRLRGELDLATVGQVLTAVGAEVDHLAPGQPPRATSLPVTIDLSAAAFIDVAGARGLVQASRAARATGTQVALVCPPTNTRVRRVLDLLQVSARMPLADAPTADLPTGP